jgi:mannose-6-phosphate isomerase-like protein (cupin superfamily)
MKAALWIAALLMSNGVITAQQSLMPESVKIWPKGMPPGGIKEKDNYGDHILSVSHREMDGVVEMHERKDDAMVIQSGEATPVYGSHRKLVSPGDERLLRPEHGVRHMEILSEVLSVWRTVTSGHGRVGDHRPASEC